MLTSQSVSCKNNQILKGTTFFHQILLVCLMAITTGILAQIKISLPFTPVPITGQTLAVILACPLIGSRLGIWSQIIYVALGFIGLPWFSGAEGGWQVATGATVGYLFGFMITPLVMGWLSERLPTQKAINLLIHFLVGHAVIFLFGLSYLYLFLNGRHQATNLSALLQLGLIPFLPGLVLKTGLAFIITKPFLKR